MADIQITCITKPEPQNIHEAITHVGGAGWKKTVATVIKEIEDKVNTYYTFVGQRAEVLVVNGANGKYLRSHRDGTPNDNLLALPQCP